MNTTTFFNAFKYETNSGVIHLYFIVKESWRRKIKVLPELEPIINYFVYAISKSKYKIILIIVPDKDDPF